MTQQLRCPDRCRDCAIFLAATIAKEYEHCDPDTAPRYCNITGVMVQPMCFCSKFRPGDSVWRPAITIDDLAKIKKSAEKDGVEIRLKYAPYGGNGHLPAKIITAKSPTYCDDIGACGPIAEMWAVIVNHWDMGTVEWRPAP